MKRNFLFALILGLLWFNHGQAKTPLFQVKPVTSGAQEIEPGKVFTLTLLVKNPNASAITLSEQVELPSGWKQVIPSASLKLAAGESKARILPLSSPLFCPAGEYQVLYRLTEANGETLELPIKVTVLPLAKLEMSIESKPEMVIAGDAYPVRFRLLNRGNCDIEAKLSAKTNPDYPVQLEGKNLITLAVGKSMAFTLKVKTDHNITAKTNQHLEIKAEAQNLTRGQITAFQSFSVNIIPRVSRDFQPFYLLKSKLTLIGTGVTGLKPANQFELSGSGSLSDKKEKYVDFLVRSPDLQIYSPYGQRKESHLNYKTATYALNLGDRSYFLSPLTENFLFGRGVDFHYYPKGKWALGGYNMNSLYTDPTDTELGAYLQYRFNKKFLLRGNLLHKNQPPNDVAPSGNFQISSLEAKLGEPQSNNLGLEYSTCLNTTNLLNDYAYRANFNLMIREANLTFEKYYAGPNYYGYYNDSDNCWTNLALPINKKISSVLNYRQSRNNLNLNPIYTIANSDRYFNAGFSYALSGGEFLSLYYSLYQQRDLQLPEDYNYWENDFKLGLSKTFSKFNLVGYLENGYFNNRVTGQNQPMNRASLYLYYHPTAKQNYSIFAISGNNYFSPNPDKNQSGGISGTWYLGKNLLLNLTYNKYLSVNNDEQDNFFSNLTYNLPNGASLQFKSSLTNNKAALNKNSGTYLAYSYPFSIPIAKRATGSISGTVLNLSTQPPTPQANIILKVGKLTAVSDREGNFIFPALKPDTYSLWVEKSSLGSELVTQQKMPWTLEVKSAKSQQLTVNLVRGARVYGKIRVYQLKQAAKLTQVNETELVETGGLANAQVILTDGEETIEQITDDEGKFLFESIRPSNWRISFYPQQLPPNYRVAPEELLLQIKPGDDKELQIKVLPIRREINIIKKVKLQQEISPYKEKFRSKRTSP